MISSPFFFLLFFPPSIYLSVLSASCVKSQVLDTPERNRNKLPCRLLLLLLLMMINGNDNHDRHDKELKFGPALRWESSPEITAAASKGCCAACRTKPSHCADDCCRYSCTCTSPQCGRGWPRLKLLWWLRFVQSWHVEKRSK
ncbi:hypothetical protein BD289DRAFT_448782 [Coniella lustricola]|uniref:Uncharacterized protein n=1 Tax=Coniella lustricola TaxID=2025994 RepID=A0A2T2ZRX1_9PEZI|nr:hypothetical protein BD289DRAFT_448782 [Coniella lustricola]